MKANNKVVVAYQPLSMTIVVGELNKDGNTFIGEKYNVEDSAIKAVSEFLIETDIRIEFEYKGQMKVLQIIDK